MTNRINAINSNLTAALDGINSLSADLVKAANQHKATLLEILAELGNSYAALSELRKLCNNAGCALLDIGEYCGDTADNIHDTICECENIPTGSYGTFVGFCDECGEELHTGDEYETLDNGNVICVKCATTPAEADAEPASEEVETNV